MNKKHIERIKDILSEWNPLGDMANQISDLENYEIEATDILFHINKKKIGGANIKNNKDRFGAGL